ncbi:MAG TPA: DMT family transporter [Steroidobacteraceae bacterium]|nr:DMT family transporter [Steroidobacteraceae bacterium]
MSHSADRTRRAAGFLAAVAAVSVWAGWLPVTRLAVTGRFSPEDVAALRFGAAGLLLAPVLLLRWREVPWRRASMMLPLLIGAGVPYQLLFGHGVAIANSGQAAVLGPGIVSSCVAVLAVLFLGEHLRRGQVIGLGATLAGVAVVVGHDLATGSARIGGYLLIMLASLHWSAYTTASRALRLHPVVNAAAVAVVNAAIYLPIYVASGKAARLAEIPAGALWLQLVYQGILTAVLALIAFAFAVERLGAAAAASIVPLTPVLATLFGWLLLGDSVDAATATGLAAVATGVLLANRGIAAPTSRR